MPARRPARRPGPTASCWAAANRVAHVLVDELGVVPGNRVLLRGPNNPWLVGLLVRRAQGRRGRGHDDAAAARRRAAHHPRDRADRPSRCATTGSSTTSQAAGLGGAGRVLRRRRRRRPGAARCTAPARRSTPSTPRPTTWRCWRSPRGTTGRPKATMHFHRDVLAIADTFSRHVLAADPGRRVHRHSAARVHVRARRRWWCSRCASAPRRCWSRRRRRPSSPTLIAAHGVTVCFTAPTAYRAMLAAGKADRLRSLRARRVRRRAPAARDLGGVPRGDRRADHRRHRLDRDAAHLHLRGGRRHPAGVDRASRCRATSRRCSTTTGNPVPAGTPGRLAVKGPTGCRYLADPRQARLRRRTAGTSPATRSAATRTATSGTRRAATT